MTTERIDVLAVMSPPASQVTKPEDWKLEGEIRQPTKESEARLHQEAKAGSTAPAPLEYETLRLYKSVMGQAVKAPEVAKPMAIIDAGKLAEARAAVAELIEENKRLKVKADRWDDLLTARARTTEDAEDTKWKVLARAGRVIEAIKECRSLNGLSLRESKDCVEGYLARVGGA